MNNNNNNQKELDKIDLFIETKTEGNFSLNSERFEDAMLETIMRMMERDDYWTTWNDFDEIDREDQAVLYMSNGKDTMEDVFRTFIPEMKKKLEAEGWIDWAIDSMMIEFKSYCEEFFPAYIFSEGKEDGVHSFEAEEIVNVFIDVEGKKAYFSKHTDFDKTNKMLEILQERFPDAEAFEDKFEWMVD